MKVILVLATIVMMVSFFLFTLKPSNSFPQFSEFKVKYGKEYASVEEQEYRRGIFLMNVMKITAHNADPTQTYKQGINKFTDLTQDEFMKIYLNNQLASQTPRKRNIQKLNETQPRKNSIDWVKDGKVSIVKNQGACGSCWSFSATGSIESRYLFAGVNIVLSEQQLMDCSRDYGNNGCNGGWTDAGFKFAIDHGLVTEKEYPYLAKDQPDCKRSEGPYKIHGYTDIEGCDGLELALNFGVVSVAADASNWSPYQSGIVSECGTVTGHAVLAVGYDQDSWKVKNSWGPDWGENGYIRLSRGNTCSICVMPSFAIL